MKPNEHFGFSDEDGTKLDQTDIYLQLLNFKDFVQTNFKFIMPTKILSRRAIKFWNVQ